jgi:hypothetical protein
MLWLLRTMLGARLRIGAADETGRIEVEIGSNHARALAGEIGGLGSLMHIKGPPEVVAALARIGEELTGLYGPSEEILVGATP